MPADEDPIGLRQAAPLINRKGPAGVLGFAKAKGVPVFDIGGKRVVFASQIRAALRESVVV